MPAGWLIAIVKIQTPRIKKLIFYEILLYMELLFSD